MKRMSLTQLKKAIPKKYHHKLELTEERIDWDEARLFLSTADGYCWCPETHLYSFDTLSELKSAICFIQECHCEDCEIARAKTEGK
jgi:hypothetical protein